MRALFRLDGTEERHPAVIRWLNDHRDPVGDLARSAYDRIRQCGGDVREVLHDGQPTACVRGAAFAYVAAFTAHVDVGFFHGAELPDPEGLQEGTGRFMRHVKLRPGVAVDTVALSALITAAYVDVNQRLALE